MLEKLKQKLKNEKGNTIILFLLTVPLMLGMFGIAADAIIYTNVKAGVQSSLDSASTVYASSTKDPTRFSGSYKTVYKNNLNPISGFLECQPTCGNNITVTNNGNGSVTLNASEKVHFIFINEASSIFNILFPDASTAVENLKTLNLQATAVIK